MDNQQLNAKFMAFMVLPPMCNLDYIPSEVLLNTFAGTAFLVFCLFDFPLVYLASLYLLKDVQGFY